MTIAHIGPPLARQGGPAGYLWQLEAAAVAHGNGSAPRLTFPARSVPTRTRPASPVARARAVLARAKHTLMRPSGFYRPSEDEVRRPHGEIDAMIAASLRAACVEARPSMDEALSSEADVLFAHDAAVADRLLAARRRGQQVWLLLHSPMPMALYLAWSWAIPEWDWRDIARLPDTDRWTAWEVDVCSRVDRLVVPCVEAFAELVRADARFAALGRPDTVLTGCAAPARRFAGESLQALRRRWGLPSGVPVGLFLGSAQPYRGMDRLVEAVKTVPRSVGGIIAVAGPSEHRVPAHSRIRPLGPVADVGDLLHAVDFVINVNHFSLFDLATIEAAEAGRPMLLHRVGGNCRFAQLGVGCVMLADLEPTTIAHGLTELFETSESTRRMLGDRSRACYERHLTPAHLWSNHAALYDRVAGQQPASSLV